MFIFGEDDHHDNVYDYISEIEKDRIYFGGFPNQSMMNELLSQKFNLIVNLTNENEKDVSKKDIELYHITPSPPGFPERDIKYIHFPINDHSPPSSIFEYCKFITQMVKEYHAGRKIYIHCRGGHGRSSMVCVSLIYLLRFSFSLYQSIQHVTECHHSRVHLRVGWRRRKSPFNSDQYHFLNRIHKTIHINLEVDVETNPIKNKYYNFLVFTEPMFIYTTLPSLQKIQRQYKEEKKSRYAFAQTPSHTSHTLHTSHTSHTLYAYNNIYDLYCDLSLSYRQKVELFKLFVNNKFEEKTEIENFENKEELSKKLYLTYLKKIIPSDAINEEMCQLYHDTISSIREQWCFS